MEHAPEEKAVVTREILRSHNILETKNKRSCDFWRAWTWQCLSTQASKFRHFTTHRASAAFEILLACVIIGNTAYAMDALCEDYDVDDRGDVRSHRYFHLLIQAPTTLFFIAEYLLRIWACVESEMYKHSILGRLKWMLKPLSILDLACCGLVSVSLFNLTTHGDKWKDSIFTFVVLRLLLLLRFERQLKAFKRIYQIIASRGEEMILATFFTMCCILYSGITFYLIEHNEDEKDTDNLGDATYWSVQTITTLGFGDVVPQSIFGKIISCVVAFLGVIVLALPTGIFSSTFMELVAKERRRKSMIRRDINSGDDGANRASEGPTGAAQILLHDVRSLIHDVDALHEKALEIIRSGSNERGT